MWDEQLCHCKCRTRNHLHLGRIYFHAYILLHNVKYSVLYSEIISLNTMVSYTETIVNIWAYGSHWHFENTFRLLQPVTRNHHLIVACKDNVGTWCQQFLLQTLQGSLLRFYSTYNYGYTPLLCLYTLNLSQLKHFLSFPFEIKSWTWEQFVTRVGAAFDTWR